LFLFCFVFFITVYLFIIFSIFVVINTPGKTHSLNSMNHRYWQNRVTLISEDMRTMRAPEMADLLVSELLGSFGDNELSPECLDGAQKFLKRNNFIFILSLLNWF
jgi:hypothetical protein